MNRRVAAKALAVGAVAILAGAAATHRTPPAAAAAPLQSLYAAASSWWGAGDGRTFPASADYDNPGGQLRVLNTGGAIDTQGHAFFAPIGANGRACVTCHQPSDGMGLSAETARQRWRDTGGKASLFAAIDGSNCPSLPQDQAASHSLLLERGLIRIAMPWPPRAADGKAMVPEFSVAVVRDPTGCNTDPVYGLKSPTPAVSVFRRPRPVANMKFLTELPHGVPPHEVFVYNDKSLLPKDPETGAFVSSQLMSDGRVPSLRAQARDAAHNHLQAAGPLTEQQLAQITGFETQVYVAQSRHTVGGELTGEGAPPGLGPQALAGGAPARLGNNPINKIFGSFAMWLDQAPRPGETAAQRDERLFRASAARGAEIYYSRRFLIKDVGDYNDKGLGNPFKRSCGSGCHNTLLAGMDLAPGYMDLGLNSYPWAPGRDDLPLFKVVCAPTAPPQSYLGRTIFTHDPGRALVTGKCKDVGATMTQQLRGLAARAPYFAGGSAASLRELVDFYDRRFNIGYTDEEKQDLINFLSTL